MSSVYLYPSLPVELHAHIVQSIKKKKDLFTLAVINRFFNSLLQEPLRQKLFYYNLKKRVLQLDELHIRQNLFWRYCVKLMPMDPRLTYRSDALWRNWKRMKPDNPYREGVARKLELALTNAEHRINSQKKIKLRRILRPKISFRKCALYLFLGTIALIYLYVLVTIGLQMTTPKCRMVNGTFDVPLHQKCYFVTHGPLCAIEKAGENETHLHYRIVPNSNCSMTLQ